MKVASVTPSDAAPCELHPPAAVYERELEASVERVWENVLDWEHLPFVHAQAFSSVRMDSISPDGWHGVVGIPGTSGATAEIDVQLDRANLRYTTRTVAGVGAGTEILTSLFPRSQYRTGIRVDFHIPWAPAHAATSIGEVYRNLYEKLWDQDEAMMRERQRVVEAAAPTSSAKQASRSRVLLGRVTELASRLPLQVELGGRRFRVLSIDGELIAHDLRCPHLGGPLGEGSVDGCEAFCPWHGYRFDLRSGRSSDGRALRLAPSAIVEINACDGEVHLRLP